MEANHFGQFGQPVYNPDTRFWNFTRELCHPPIVDPADLSTIRVLQDQNKQFDDSKPGRSTKLGESVKWRDLNTHLRNLSKDHPGLSDLHGAIVLESTVSSVIESASSRHDPSVGDCLTNGFINALDARVLPFVGYVGGENRDVICVREIVDELHSWDRESDARVNLPRASSAIARLSTTGQSVKQLVFSHINRGKSMVLAVRLSAATVLIDPRLRDYLVPCRDLAGSVCSQQCSSPFELRPLITIPSRATGGSPHTHIEFNPWKQSQFVIIDERLHWRIFNLSFRNVDQDTGVKMIDGISGTITKHIQSGKFTARQIRDEDGWGRALWVHSSDFLLTCSRTTALIFDLATPDTVAVELELGLTKGKNCILDVRRRLLNRSQFIVLTSRHLLWYEVSVGISTNSTQASLLLSWEHQRSVTDTSLAMALCERDQDVSLIIHSRIYGTATLHRLFDTSPTEQLQTDRRHRYSISAPIYIPVAKVSPLQSSFSIPQSILFSHSPWIHKLNKNSSAASKARDRGSWLMLNKVSFLSLTLGFLDDTPTLQILTLSPPQVKPTFPPRHIHRNTPYGNHSQYKRMVQSFIVDSDEDMGQIIPISSLGSKIQSISATDPIDLSTLSHPYQIQGPPRTVGVAPLVKRLRKTFQSNPISSQRKVQTFYEIAPLVRAGELDEDSACLADFVRRTFASSDGGLQTGRGLDSLGYSGRAGSGLALYEYLCSVWLKECLLSHANSWDRIFRERIIRDLCFNHVLASTVVRFLKPDFQDYRPNEGQESSDRDGVDGIPVIELATPRSSQLADSFSKFQDLALEQKDSSHSHFCQTMGRLQRLIDGEDPHTKDKEEDILLPSEQTEENGGEEIDGKSDIQLPDLYSMPSLGTSNHLIPSSQLSPTHTTVDLKLGGVTAVRSILQTSNRKLFGDLLLDVTPTTTCHRTNDGTKCEYTDQKIGKSSAAQAIYRTWVINFNTEPQPFANLGNPPNSEHVTETLSDFWKLAIDEIVFKDTAQGQESPTSARRRQKRELRQREKLVRKQKLEERRAEKARSTSQSQPPQSQYSLSQMPTTQSPFSHETPFPSSAPPSVQPLRRMPAPPIFQPQKYSTISSPDNDSKDLYQEYDPQSMLPPNDVFGPSQLMESSQALSQVLSSSQAFPTSFSSSQVMSFPNSGMPTPTSQLGGRPAKKRARRKDGF